MTAAAPTADILAARSVPDALTDAGPGGRALARACPGGTTGPLAGMADLCAAPTACMLASFALPLRSRQAPRFGRRAVRACADLQFQQARGRTLLGCLAHRDADLSTARTASGRLSFAKIREPLEVPDLLALQTESFDWLLGNERWQARVAAAKAAGRADVPDRSGLEEIFEEISPIEDFSGSMSLSFRDHRFEDAEVLHRGVQGARP